MYHTPSLMACGSALVISPDGSHHVPPELWGQYAAIVLLEPEPPLLAQWVRDLETGLGVNDAHRRALEFSPQEVVASIRLEQEARGLRTAHTGGQIELPDAERGVSPDDVKMLDRLNRRLAANAYVSDRHMSAAERREKDLIAREDLERKHRERAESAEISAGKAESEELAVGRGEEVSTDTAGVRRVLDRDPLLRMANAGHLTPEQLETGRELTDLYETRAQDLGAMEYTGMPSGAHDHEKFVAKRFVRAKASEMIGRVERAVAINCSAEPACLTMLRAVCERWMSLTSQGRGRAYDRNAAAIARALDVAEDVLRRRI